jgi:hypothetical protein
MTKTIELTLSQEEAQQALQLIDLAIKAGGVQVARAGADLAEKIAKPASEEPDEE